MAVAAIFVGVAQQQWCVASTMTVMLEGAALGTTIASAVLEDAEPETTRKLVITSIALGLGGFCFRDCICRVVRFAGHVRGGYINALHLAQKERLITRGVTCGEVVSNLASIICNVKWMLILNLEVCKNREISLLCMNRLTREKIAPAILMGLL